MASIASQLRMNDGMTPVLRRIKQAMDNTIVSFRTMQNVSGTAVDTAGITKANEQLTKTNTTIGQIEQSLNDAAKSQGNFNRQLQAGSGFADGLLSKIKGIVATMGAGYGIKQLVGISDDMTGAKARLSLIVDDGGSVQELQNKIFASAQASRGAYLDTMNTVSKLGLMAGQAFSGNDEMIKFSELMNKNFIIAGASAQEQSSAMYQLTQAMASGRLQGDEYRSIIENAPLLAKSIESYMQNAGVEGTMKEWASDGMLTADVIKNALFSSADQVEERFAKMPMTWGQIWTNIKNRAIVALEPVLNKINELANNQEIQTFIDNILNGFMNLVMAAMTVFEWVANIYNFFQENWSTIVPIIGGITLAVISYQSALLAAKVALTIVAMAQGLFSVLTGAQTAATSTATGAQWGLNAALYACPIFWIIIAIVLLIVTIYGVTAAINNFSETTYSATGVICGSFMFLVATVWNLLISFSNLVIDLGVLIINLFADVGNFLGNVFVDPIGSICHLFIDLADFVLGIVEGLAGALDTLFGSNLADSVQGWRNNMQSWANSTFGEQKIYFDHINGDDYKMKRWDPFEAFDSGYKFGEGIDKKIGGLFNFDKGNGAGESDFDYTGTSTPYDQLNNIEDNTDTIASNSGSSDENLKLLREIAEREAINRFTTAEVKVDMTGMSNSISSDMDIDGFMDKFTGKLESALLTTAEGVHI